MPQWPTADRVNLDRMRKERVERVRERMQELGVGSLLCFDPANVRYLTDVYGGVAGDVMLARNVLFPRTGDPILFEWGSRWRRIRDELAPWMKGNVKPGWRIYFYLGAGIYPQEFMNDLRKTLSEHDVLNEPMAIDAPIITLDFPEIFKKGNIKLAPDGHRLVPSCRITKTQDEVECQRLAASICDEVFAEFRNAIRPGIRECDLQAIGTSVSVRHGADQAVGLCVVSGENGNPNMGGYSDRPIRLGDMIYVDPAPISYRGYHACYYRTFTCGKATPLQKELYAEALRLLKASMARVKAGATTAEICDAWPGPEHWGANSFWDISNQAIGHGIGLSVQEAPGITPLFSREHPVTLREGMVIALETWFGSQKPRQGTLVEETMVVTKDGYDLITDWPIEEITECY